MSSQRLLTDLGHRIRAARSARGLAVGELASRAGVSRRYLTEAEAGRANLSVLKLADLAAALGVRMGDLIELRATASSERIALVGLRGAGKSTLGRGLALELEVPFVELDLEVEAQAGLTLAEIFALHGEDGFHRFEAEALERALAANGRMVLASGGSIVESGATFERLRRACRTIWIRARPADHVQRVLGQGDGRPMRDRPRAMAELEALLARREPLYARCDALLDTHGKSLEAVRAELLMLVSRGDGTTVGTATS